MMIAEEGIEELRKNVDAIVVIPNDKLLKTLPEDVTLMDAFMECNRVLMKAVKGVSDIIYKEGYMNLDFNDVRAVLSDSGEALIGMGIGEGETGVDDALEEAINCPLLEDVSNMIPSGIIVNVSVPNGFTLKKLAYIGQQIEAKFPTDSIVKYGVIYDSNLKKDQISATVLLTGLKPRENVDTIQEDNDGLDLGGAFVEDVPAQAQKPASSFGEYSLPSFLTRKG
jgi:cell division protein FtsZ